jgi:tRNA 2-thiouridine synthesizing protein E
MTDKDKKAVTFAEAVELMDMSVDTDIESQQRTKRELELQEWSEERAKAIAKQEGIELTVAHFQVIHLLRDYYLENGMAGSSRELADMLDMAMSEKGGRKYLYRLFSKGPVSQGMRIAGLPVPSGSEDKSFGTAH